MKQKLTDRAIRYAIRQLKKGRGTRVVAEELGVTQRHIQRLWAEYLSTGKVHVQIPAGRPADPEPSEQEIQAVLDVHGRKPEGVVRTAKRLRKEGHDISRYRAYGIMKSAGLVTDSPARSRQRKWVRYERLYSNAMWHTDWHTMKDPRMKGLNLITYLDDASRCVTGPSHSKRPPRGAQWPHSGMPYAGSACRPPSVGQRILLCGQGRPQEAGRYLGPDHI